MARAHGSIAQWLTIRKQVGGHAIRWYRRGPGLADWRLWASVAKIPWTSRLRGGGSVAPKILKSCRRQLGVAHRVLDVAVAQPVLKRPGVVTGVRQGVAARVAEHVAMEVKAKRAGEQRISSVYPSLSATTSRLSRH